MALDRCEQSWSDAHNLGEVKFRPRKPKNLTS